MTDEEQTVLLIRGTIAGLPESDQARVKELAEKFRAMVGTQGGHAALAFALVGAELAAQP